MTKPYLLDFSNPRSADISYISVLEVSEAIPFAVNRIFWTYHTPEMIVRGRHAHHHTEQVLIAMMGRIMVTTEMPDGELSVFLMESPQQGVYIPPHAWHTMQYSHRAIQLVLASTSYDEQDYIRDHATFRRVWGT